MAQQAKGKSPAETIKLTATEQKWYLQYRSLENKTLAIEKEEERLSFKKAELELKGKPLPAQQQAELLLLQSQIAVLRKGFDAYFEAMRVEAKDLAAGVRAVANERLDQCLSVKPLLARLAAQGDANVAFVYSLVTSSGVDYILLTASGQQAISVKIQSDQLNELIARFRGVLMTPTADPRPIGKEVYDRLFSSVIPNLLNAGIKHIVWCLDGPLGYIPVNAIWDGSEYLIERIQSTFFDPLRLDGFLLPEQAAERVAAFGTSKGKLPEFAPLPGTREELRSVVSDRRAGFLGPVPGRAFEDESFNREALEAALHSDDFSVIHISAHLRIGKDLASTELLLGDGSLVSFDDILGWVTNNRLGHLDLICVPYAGFGEALGGSSFVSLLMAEGARSVLAPLWAVYDKSTPQLMRAFYQGWMGNRQGGVGAALRNAQLSLLHTNEFAHPCYWSPFQLYGSWQPSRPAAGPTVQEPKQRITAAVFSPDNREIVTGSLDGTAQLWDSASGLALRSYPVKTAISSVAVSADGKTIVIGTSEGAVEFAETGQRLKPFATSSSVTSVVLSPDQSVVVTGCEDGTASIWRQTGSTPPILLKGHSDQVSSVACSPDSRFVLTGSFDHSVRLWDSRDGTLLRTFSGNTDAVTSVAFSPDGKRILVGSFDSTAKLWDVSTGALIQTFSGHNAAVYSVAFSPDGKRILTGSGDGTAKLWDAGTGAVLETARQAGGVSSAAFSPDSRYVLTVGSDGSARLWDSPTGQLLRVFSEAPERPQGALNGAGAVQFPDYESPTHSQMASACLPGSFASDTEPISTPVNNESACEMQPQQNRGGGSADVSASGYHRVGKDYALIIATDHYDVQGVQPLQNPIRDGSNIAKILEEQYGFTVLPLYDKPLREIWNALNDFADAAKYKIRPDDQLLVYVAGHGAWLPNPDQPSTGQGYILTRESDPRKPDPLSSMPYVNLWTRLNSLPFKKVLLILDVCFGGTFSSEMEATRAADAPSPPKMAKEELRNFIAIHMAEDKTRWVESSGDGAVPDGGPTGSPFAKRVQDCLLRFNESRYYLTEKELDDWVEGLHSVPRGAPFGAYKPGSHFFLFPKAFWQGF